MSQDLVDFSRRHFDGAIRSLSSCESACLGLRVLELACCASVACLCLRTLFHCAARDRSLVLLGSVQGEVWRIPVHFGRGGDARNEGDGAVLLCRNHGCLAPRLLEGVGSGASASVSSVGGSGVSDEVLKGVGARVAAVVGVSYAPGVSDKFATVADDNTVCSM